MKCISLFSGCGGLDFGLEAAGFDILLANDNWELAQRTHIRNFPETVFERCSISDLTYDRIVELLGEEALADLDLLAGGPPCPPFSKSRFYRKEKPRALKDPDGEETLAGYLRILGETRPRAFLFENVHGFAYKVHADALERLLDTAQELSYQCSYRVINSADFGVPQIRQRFFMVGTREGEFKFPPPSHHDPTKPDLFTSATLPWVMAGDAIADLDTEENASDDGHFAGGRHHQLLRQVPPGDNYLFFTEKRGYPDPIFKWRSRYWSFLLKLSKSMPSWTIQARRSNNMGPFHWRNRILRIEEVKRLQTFSDNFQLEGSIEDQWRQVGNAVPPLLAGVLGGAIAAHIRRGTQKDDRISGKSTAVG